MARCASDSAERLFRLGKIDDAFAAFKQAVLNDPALEPAAVSMAWLYGQKGDVQEGRGMVRLRAKARAEKRAGAPRACEMAAGSGTARPTLAPRSTRP